LKRLETTILVQRFLSAATSTGGKVVLELSMERMMASFSPCCAAFKASTLEEE